MIVPTDLADLGVPVVGDDLVITGCTTIYPSGANKSTWLASLPRRPASGDSLKVLLKAAARIRLKLARACSQNVVAPEREEELRVDLKQVLEHYRSILDYLAQDIKSLCPKSLSRSTHKSRKLYFPIVGVKESERDFHIRFQGEYPGLHHTAPRLFQHLLDIQRFKGEVWLDQLAALVNPIKHRELSRWETIDSLCLVIHHDGTGFRLGDLGFRSITLTEGASIELVSPASAPCCIRGPERLTVDTKSLANADSGIRLDRVNCKTTAVSGTSISIAGLLAQIEGGIRSTCLEVTRACHP